MPTLVIGLDHSKAPLDLLEQVTINEAEISGVLRSLIANENIQEVALVSTCLRTEIYLVADRFHDAVDDATGVVAVKAPAPVQENFGVVPGPEHPGKMG